MPRAALNGLGQRRNGARRKGRVFTAAEFFAGIGLVRLALERQGWRVVFANDIDPDKAEMYRHNWPKDDHLVVEDIHKLDVDDIPTCDLFTASFPCNDLSIAGRWEGLNGKESSAFWGLIRILREMDDRRPPLVMLENVVGFLMSHKGRDFEQAMLALNELGYTVDALILNAIRWTPQSRARLFVIAKLGAGAERKSFAGTYANFLGCRSRAAGCTRS
jgi:DNA (cytosine-5)-methyltransferase 1